MLTTGLKAEVEGFLRAIEVHTTTSVGWEIKPGPQVLYLLLVKEHLTHVNG
jgi:hypothetical protein